MSRPRGRLEGGSSGVRFPGVFSSCRGGPGAPRRTPGAHDADAPFLQRLQRIRNLSIADARARQFARILGSQSQLAPWDSQGRIRIKDELLAFADLREQITSWHAESSSAAVRMSPRFVAVASSSRSRKTGAILSGTGPNSVSRPTSRFGIVSISLGITQSGETVNLYHQIHVDNTP